MSVQPYIAQRYDDAVEVRDVGSEKLIAEFKVPEVRWANCNAGRVAILSGGSTWQDERRESGHVDLYDVETKKLLRRIPLRDPGALWRHVTLSRAVVKVYGVTNAMHSVHILEHHWAPRCLWEQVLLVFAVLRGEGLEREEQGVAEAVTRFLV